MNLAGGELSRRPVGVVAFRFIPAMISSAAPLVGSRPHAPGNGVLGLIVATLARISPKPTIPVIRAASSLKRSSSRSIGAAIATRAPSASSYARVNGE